MPQPSVPTIKRLFALSGNRCAFPKCPQSLLHEDKVTGRICHIKAASPQGPRSDLSQSEVDRHGFENLILMCPIHHDVIDADEVAYTVMRLKMMKAAHEAAGTPVPAISDQAAMQLIVNVQNAEITHTSTANITSHNQSGGFTGINTGIVHVGPKPRDITPEQEKKLLEILASAPKFPIRVVAFSSNQESIDFARAIRSVLDKAGFGNSGTLPVESIIGPSMNIPDRSRVAISCSTDSGLQSGRPIRDALTSVGIPTGYAMDGGILRPGEIGIVVSDR